MIGENFRLFIADAGQELNQHAAGNLDPTFGNDVDAEDDGCGRLLRLVQIDCEVLGEVARHEVDDSAVGIAVARITGHHELAAPPDDTRNVEVTIGASGCGCERVGSHRADPARR